MSEPLNLEPIKARWDTGFGPTQRYPAATEQQDYEDVHSLLAEIDRLREQVAAVEVLADEWRDFGDSTIYMDDAAADLAQALDGAA